MGCCEKEEDHADINNKGECWFCGKPMPKKGNTVKESSVSLNRIRTALERANMQLVAYGANNTNFIREAITELNLMGEAVPKLADTSADSSEVQRSAVCTMEDTSPAIHTLNHKTVENAARELAKYYAKNFPASMGMPLWEHLTGLANAALSVFASEIRLPGKERCIADDQRAIDAFYEGYDKTNADFKANGFTGLKPIIGGIRSLLAATQQRREIVGAEFTDDEGTHIFYKGQWFITDKTEIEGE